ncbi:MAG TPA: glycosyltransferase family 9 protein [Vicinamibacterales bacterium]|nr:glycosyltransferase family 9 protein [Vicinamibacterales bacterium]
MRLREIGDVVFTTPAVSALRRHFPSARLTYIVEPSAAPVVERNPHLDELIVAPRRQGISGLLADVALGRRLRREKFDLAVDFHGGPRASLLTWLSGARSRIGYDVAGRGWMYTTRVARPRELRRRHSVENQWDLLSAAGVDAKPSPEAFPVEMTVPPAVEAAVTERLARAGLRPSQQLVVIHVSAGNPFRRWPFQSFVSLATGLARTHANVSVAITSGPSDADAARRVIDAARAALDTDRDRERILRCGEFSLAELRALADRASLYVGGDSGPLHIAATSRVPIVGLYGPTLPVRSAPWRGSECVSESVDAGELPCRPCEQRVCAPGDFRCLTRIAPERVLAAAGRALERSTR